MDITIKQGGNKMQENEEYKLYIPTNVKTRLEFFKGFGVKELISSIIVMLVLLPGSITIYFIKDNYLLPVIVEFIGVAGAVIFTTKDDNNLCVVNQIKYMIEFSKIQKQYKYKYYNKRRKDIV